MVLFSVSLVVRTSLCVITTVAPDQVALRLESVFFSICSIFSGYNFMT